MKSKEEILARLLLDKHITVEEFTTLLSESKYINYIPYQQPSPYEGNTYPWTQPKIYFGTERATRW